jgi:hypothetical protein
VAVVAGALEIVDQVGVRRRGFLVTVIILMGSEEVKVDNVLLRTIRGVKVRKPI